MGDQQPTVAVLAGGAGSRIGGAKATIPLAGRPLASYPLAAAAEAGLEAILVTKSGADRPAIEVPVLEESDPLVHPLTGVLAALDRYPRRAVIALACDLPFVPAALLRELAGRDGATTIEVAGRIQPLLARYEATASGPIRTALCRGEAATVLLESLQPAVIGEADLARFGDPQRIVFNVNTPEQLAEAQSLLASLS